MDSAALGVSMQSVVFMGVEVTDAESLFYFIYVFLIRTQRQNLVLFVYSAPDIEQYLLSSTPAVLRTGQGIGEETQRL